MTKPVKFELHEGHDYIHIYDGGEYDHSGNPVAVVTTLDHAAFIVLACNAHQELVEALEMAMRWVPKEGTTRDSCEAALAKVKP